MCPGHRGRPPPCRSICGGEVPLPKQLPTKSAAKPTSCTESPEPFLQAPQPLHPALPTCLVGICWSRGWALQGRVPLGLGTPGLGCSTGTGGVDSPQDYAVPGVLWPEQASAVG